MMGQVPVCSAHQRIIASGKYDGTSLFKLRGYTVKDKSIVKAVKIDTSRLWPPSLSEEVGGGDDHDHDDDDNDDSYDRESKPNRGHLGFRNTARSVIADDDATPSSSAPSSSSPSSPSSSSPKFSGLGRYNDLYTRLPPASEFSCAIPGCPNAASVWRDVSPRKRKRSRNTRGEVVRTARKVGQIPICDVHDGLVSSGKFDGVSLRKLPAYYD